MTDSRNLSAQELKNLAKVIARECPETWRLISQKRYILPTYRQGDYFSQDILDILMAAFLLSYVCGDYGRSPDDVNCAMYRTAVTALLEGRPMWFLERELGEKLLVTQFPGDLTTDEIHWRRRIMRIMLPRGLVVCNRPEYDRPRSLMYVDISRVDTLEFEEVKRFDGMELRMCGAKRGYVKLKTVPVPLFEKLGICICGQMEDFDGYPTENYALIRPFNPGLKLKEIQSGEHFATNIACDDADDTFLARMENIAINVLLFMGSIPLEYEPAENKPIRKLEVLKDRIVPELLAAKFVGSSQYRPSQKPHYHIAAFSGKRLPKHWRGGHWKRQVFGPGRHERKLIWVEPYETFGPEPEEEKKEETKQK